MSVKTPEKKEAVKKGNTSKSIIKRIDIGLTTAICALFVSIVALFVGIKEIRIAEDVGKAEVLPIIDIDFGYVPKQGDGEVVSQYFDVVLSNVGAGIAHIQKVSLSQHGEQITHYVDFEDAVMTRRMRSWSELVETSSTGYLRAGESITPVSYKLGRTAESDLSNYLRGNWGVPMDQVDVHVCYCSVFEECWAINFLDRKVPEPVENCGIDDEVSDVFNEFIEQKKKERLQNAKN